MQGSIDYAIDCDDRLVQVGGDWQRFADANGGVPAVLGHDLWSFIAGAEVRATWRLLIHRARRGQIQLRFLYRCDGPGIRRLLQMEVVPRRDGGVYFRSTEIESEPGETFVPQPGRTGDAVTVCGWCGGVRIDGWVSPERATELLGLTTGVAPVLSHGICETCAAELRVLPGA